MAARDGGKRTRFACLETARCMVATTVSVLTVAVVVMVTIAALRPVEFNLSIVHGMDSNPRWVVQEVRNSTSLSSPSSAAAAGTTTPLVAATNVTFGGGGNSSSSTLRIAQQVNLTFTLLAYNPSGRKEIHIFNFTVRVVDMPKFPRFDGMRNIAAFPVPVRYIINLKRQGGHYLRSKFPLRDAGSVSYVANTYGAEGTLKAMVLVKASIGSASRSSTPRNVTYYCWPVLVGWTAYWDSPSDGVTCTSRNKLSIDVDSLLPQPEPALMTPALIA